jgi:hypothetical protein
VRRSNKQAEPHSFVLAIDVLPELVKLLQRDLIQGGRQDLAHSVTELRIYRRCDCPQRCGTFYCLPSQDLPRDGENASDLVGTVTITVAGDRILRVETLDSTVDDVLDPFFPKIRYTV